MPERLPVREAGGVVVVPVKAVPGGKRAGIAGVLGGALKVKVAAPAEGGRANGAVCRVLAEALGVDGGRVSIVSGHSGPRKRIAVRGLEAAEVTARLLGES